VSNVSLANINLHCKTTDTETVRRAVHVYFPAFAVTGTENKQ